MARKYFPHEAARAKVSPRVLRRSSATAPLRAHPQLIHGFLVRPAKKSTPASGPNAAFVAVKHANSAARPHSESRDEGPVDDTTFH
jgi:hypothetical protein